MPAFTKMVPSSVMVQGLLHTLGLPSCSLWVMAELIVVPQATTGRLPVQVGVVAALTLLMQMMASPTLTTPSPFRSPHCVAVLPHGVATWSGGPAMMSKMFTQSASPKVASLFTSPHEAARRPCGEPATAASAAIPTSVFFHPLFMPLLSIGLLSLGCIVVVSLTCR